MHYILGNWTFYPPALKALMFQEGTCKAWETKIWHFSFLSHSIIYLLYTQQGFAFHLLRDFYNVDDHIVGSRFFSIFLYIYIYIYEKWIFGRFKNVTFKLLSFNFVRIHINLEMLVLLKNHLTYLKIVFWNAF